MASGYEYDINDLYQEAQRRWLKPPEVMYILQNSEKYQFTQEPPKQPTSGSLFLFNRRVLRFFRKDGHAWRKKRDGRAVGEAHERLKVGNVEAINCYYAHGELNPNFQRRCYWMLEPLFDHIVLVHYRDTGEGMLSSGPGTQLSPGSSSAFSQSPRSYNTQNRGSTSIVDDSYGPNQSFSSPGSAEVTSDIFILNNGMGHSEGTEAESGTSTEVEITQALRRLEEQLSLNDESFEEIVPFYKENEATHDSKLQNQQGVIYNQEESVSLSGPDSQGLLYDGYNGRQGDSGESYRELLDRGLPDGNEKALSWKNVYLPAGNQESSQSSSIREPVTNQENSCWTNLDTDIAGNSVFSLPQGVGGATLPPFSSLVETRDTRSGYYAPLFDQSQIGVSHDSCSSLTVSQKQKFTIKAVSPEWGYASETTKVFIIGSFLCHPSDSAWACMLGDVEVPVEIIQEGVMCCEVPSHIPGNVTLCITSGNRESCSEVREFEYRDNTKSCTKCSPLEIEATRTPEELLLLVRLGQVLLSASPVMDDNNESGIFIKQKADDDSWSHVIDALLFGSGTSSSTANWLLEELLKDKLQLWLTCRSRKVDEETGCSLSKKEQGIIHMVAGLGFEWALNPILSCGVNINFRDINGWTALHWAARFGRRISGLSNGSSSLDAIKNMKSITILELRNNNISGSIPSFIGEFQSLTQLDLSFNNLSGQIPGSIFNLSSLSSLFLGNNTLNGSLPRQKSSSLNNIDLSYNDLSGSFPSWINEQNLELNLVANNLTIDDSNSSGLPTGINCLQKTFACNRGAAARYSDFAIKCGGPQIRSIDGTVYQTDNETLGPATYFVTDTERWGVSNVGIFNGNSNASFKSSVTNQFTNTVNPEIFQTARLSASSLRYYGLGLENGFYNITLQFAETAILDSTTWKGLGRRVFDIYIQGTRVLKDFDIQKQAGGVSYRAVQKQFRFEVKENYVEIHLFWAGKGTCCIPGQGTYGPLIQAISAIPDFIPTVSNKPPSTKKSRAGLIVGVVVGVGIVCLLLIFAIFFIIRRRKRYDDDDDELLGIDTMPNTFSYYELKNATSDFNRDNKLGEGGFGPVYKGTLNDGRDVAVKQLSIGSHQGKSQFVAEIATISAVQHRNLVKLYGCCIEGSKRLLVYEYLENKSLDQALFGNVLFLNWATRYDICMGVARGLTYLHEESRLRIVHRDVKASNILLDSELIPKISDFGLAKLYDDKKTHISTRVAGTIGYLAPEYAMRGHLTEKADVFSFGVVALELVSGRPNSDSSLEGEKMYLLEWAWQLHEKGCTNDLIDPRLSEFNKEEVQRLVGIALLCTQTSPTLRPPMSRVVAMLSGDIEVSAVTSRPGYLTDWKFDDVSSIMTDISLKGLDTSNYTSTASTSIAVGADQYSPKDSSKPILRETLEGR